MQSFQDNPCHTHNPSKEDQTRELQCLLPVTDGPEDTLLFQHWPHFSYLLYSAPLFFHLNHIYFPVHMK